MDRNFKSFELVEDKDIKIGTLDPTLHGWDKWSDTMKTYKCRNSTFHDGVIHGGQEDVLDIGTNTYGCIFNDIHAEGMDSMYLVTLKSHSEFNSFNRWVVHSHAKRCDIQHGNWSDSDRRGNRENFYSGWVSKQNKPFTYSYRLFSDSKPVFDTNMKVKHLWWLSLGVTIYFWGKWLWKKVTD